MPEPDAADLDVFLARIGQLLPILGQDFLRPKAAHFAKSEDPELLLCDIKGVRATGRLTADGFVVFHGSMAVLDERPSTQKYPQPSLLRSRLIEEGILSRTEKGLRFLKDYEFSSPQSTIQMNDRIPRVGVGVIVLREGLVLLGQRRGSLGEGTWALPGGHLEFGETVAQCAIREVREETGLEIQSPAPGPYTSDLLASGGKHYVTLFVVARAGTGEPKTLEPAKCLGWHWFRWSELPAPLFQPLETLRRTGFVPDHAA